MMDYVIVIQRDAKGGERDVKDWLHGFIRAIRKIRGSLPELDHGFHGFDGFATQSAPKNSGKFNQIPVVIGRHHA